MSGTLTGDEIDMLITLRQIGDQIAALVHAVCIALRAVAAKLLSPFHHVCLAPVFLDELTDAVATFAGALGAFDAERVERALDVAKNQIIASSSISGRGSVFGWVMSSASPRNEEMTSRSARF